MASRLSAKLTWTTVNPLPGGSHRESIFKDDRVIACIKVRGTLKFSNKGPHAFEGGTISQVRLIADGRRPVVLAQDLKVPKIAPGADRGVQFDIVLPEAGVFEVAYRIIPTGAQSFEMVAGPNDIPVPEWRELCVVVDREKAEIVDLLNEIVQKLPGGSYPAAEFEQKFKETEGETQTRRANGKPRKE